MTDGSSFARLVSLACHDLRTPLSTVLGFARTLPRLGSFDETTLRYLEMIASASSEMAETLDDLSLVARVEGGRYSATHRPADTLDLARAAAERVRSGRVEISGEGGRALVDPEPAERALAALASCVLRHAGLEQVSVAPAGAEIRLRPVEPRVRAIALGEDLRDLGAAIALRVVGILGGSVEASDSEVVVRLPAPETPS